MSYEMVSGPGAAELIGLGQCATDLILTEGEVIYELPEVNVCLSWERWGPEKVV